MQMRSVYNRVDEAIEEMVPKLVRYCYFLTKDKWNGEDLAQESVYKALIRYPDYQDWSPALLKKMAYHLWIDKGRKESRELIGSVPEYALEYFSKEWVSPDTIDMLSDQLTPKQLISFVLKEAFQYKISEVADLLNLTETAVKALLNRSRSKLKKISGDDEWSESESYGEDALQKELNAILYRCLKAQDPSLLLAYIPTLIATGTVHMMAQASPSSSTVLSMAA
ncbi:sigma factor-like helix-turn-helix DNA-binding protein [Rossellomorea sp. YZS02]|uniref:sigma factor-like helix-turn-helix DNA-binding protein n=1 Tax=Rossellomorea sp. YZS02 TaxID=3097358 RepID=UPI002A156B10|nr:sigma factor-like helix-turn-helix DNA-binding protein [Rossellomorea sp. YZS02]MDX8342268.1 sigma factor-like helix-turn-helix DNA-binding protein [Rossellomorea sp. YZS02]